MKHDPVGLAIIGILALPCIWLGSGFFFGSEHESKSIEIPKTRCIEICTETLLKKGVFPSDFHETIKKCELIFQNDETCLLTAKGK